MFIFGQRDLLFQVVWGTCEDLTHLLFLDMAGNKLMELPQFFGCIGHGELVTGQNDLTDIDTIRHNWTPSHMGNPCSLKGKLSGPKCSDLLNQGLPHC